MRDKKTRTERAPVVVATTLPSGEAVLLHMQTALYYTLNRTGAEIWQQLSDGQSVTTIAEDLAKRYEVTAEGSVASVEDLVRQLQVERLL